MSQLHWLFWVFSLHLADRAVIRCGGGGGGPLLAKWFIYRSCYQQHVNAQMNHTKITANAGKSHEAAAVIWAQTVVLEHAVAEAAFVIFWGWFLIWFLIWMNDNVVIKGCGGQWFYTDWFVKDLKMLTFLSLFYSSIYCIHNAPGQSHRGQHHSLLVPAWPAQWRHPGLWVAVLWEGTVGVLRTLIHTTTGSTP